MIRSISNGQIIMREIYFIERYIKIGVFVGGANLKVVSQDEGKRNISKLKLEKSGECSK